ncbi:MAG TPA: phospholipase D family protein [Burkholderiaceae bacterium]
MIRKMPGLRFLLLVLLTGMLGACSTLPPGSNYPKPVSYVMAQPQQSAVGRQFADVAKAHVGQSGFHIIPAGVDGFLMRMQMINAAEHELDLQYFIFRGDETGQLLADAVLRAADRGVRVRILVDDGDTVAGDEMIAELAAHPSIEIRIFNPFAYRGHLDFIRAMEFVFNASRLDYRMHNKLLVADNAISLVGGRNIGDEYFQIDPSSQLADDDIVAVGPIITPLSAAFDQYWNSDLAIPAKALSTSTSSPAALRERREKLREHKQELKADGTDYVTRIATGEPYNGITSGKVPLVWASAQLVCDSPDKKSVEDGKVVGKLMRRPVEKVTAEVQTELLMVTPFLIPGKEGMQLFENLLQRNVRVRILTNSLESSNEVAAQSGYMHYRKTMIEDGIELHEIRRLLGNTRGSGETRAIAEAGHYSLHAKLFVFDRNRVFIGSMNFDQRSMHLNTEIGLIIDSPELAQQVAARFFAMVQPQNAYLLSLRADTPGGTPELVWHTEENGQPVDYRTEPARSAWQRLKVHIFTLLPWDDEL